MNNKMIRKEIRFSSLLLDEINYFAKSKGLKFNEAVRILIMNALGFVPNNWIKNKNEINDVTYSNKTTLL